MRRSRTPFIFALLSSLCWAMLPAQVNARLPLATLLTPPVSLNAPGKALPGAAAEGGGIKEVIPEKYKERYQAWKNEFLSTDTGRGEWETFERGEQLTLTITVSDSDRNGAGTGKYKWNDGGELVAATITLGARIDEGYPNPIYYPVMNSLAHSEPSLLNGNILAAAKIAHEFGHVKLATLVNGAVYRLQNQLMPVYNKILLSNGRNAGDPRLIDLTRQMGGTPVEIWEDREYWGEANAMLYLRDRITKKSDQRALFSRIMRTVESYAKNYAERFDQIAR